MMMTNTNTMGATTWGEASSLKELLEIYDERDVEAARILLGLKRWELEPPNLKRRSYDPYTKKPLDPEADADIIAKKMQICEQRCMNIIRDVQNKIEEMTPDEKARGLALDKVKFSSANLPSLFAQLSEGYDVGAVSGQEEWRKEQEEKQRQKYEKSVACAQRRAEDVIKGQIKAKIAADTSEAHKKASEAALRAFRKQQENERKEKKKIDDAKRAQIRENVNAAAERRREWGDKTLEHIDEKIQRGLSKRAKGKVVDPSKKLAADARREETFAQNKGRLMDTLNKQMTKQDNAERKLQNRKDERAATLKERIRQRKIRFDAKRRQVEDHLAECQRQREDRHEKFEAHFEHVKATREQFNRDTSKHALDVRTQAFNKQGANLKNLHEQQDAHHDELAKQTSQGLEHRFKNAQENRANHIKRYQQIQTGCMKALQTENWNALVRQRDMNIEAILLKVAKRQDDFQTLQNQRNEFKQKKIEQHREAGKKDQETQSTLYRLKSETRPERIQKCLNQLGLKLDYNKLQESYQKKAGEAQSKEGKRDD